VDLAQGLAQPRRLRCEVAAHLVGVQVLLGEQVAHARQRQVPAVGGRPQELLQHPEVERRRVGSVLDPPVEGGHVRGLGQGESLVDLDVGIDAGRDLAEDLEDRVLAEGDRGVGLLSGEEGRGRLEVQIVAGHPVEPQSVGVRVRRFGEGAEPAGHRLAVMQRVVDVDPAELGILPPPDEGVVEPVLGLGVVGEWELVDLQVTRPVRRLDQVDDHPCDVGRHRHLGQPAYSGHLEVAAFAPEPAGVGQIVLDGSAQRLGIHEMKPPSGSSGSVSRNQ
jgi:hypothetical protein